MTYDLLAWTEKVSIDRMVSTNTLCCLSGTVLSGTTGTRYPFERYSNSCTNLIGKNLTRLTLVSSSDTISFNGLSYSPNVRLDYYLLLLASLNANQPYNLVPIPIPMLWCGTGGKSTSWRDAVLSYGLTYAIAPDGMPFAGTAHAVNQWGKSTPEG